MKKHLTLLLIFFLLMKIAFAFNSQVPPFCSDPRYDVNEITSPTGNYADPPLNTNPTYNFQIFYPDASVDTSKKRPFVLYIHGGGFSSGMYQEQANKCKELARRGYVSATINYFVSPWQTAMCFGPDTVALNSNIYQAIQDARAAMRYFAFHAADYKIDTSRLFIAGSSAGSITALLTAFLNQKEANADLGKHPDLGGLNNAVNGIKIHFTIRGVSDESGAVHYQNDIDKKDRIPVVSFHAVDDPLVPYGINNFFWASCGTTFPVVAGSSAVYDRLVSLGICAELTYLNASSHGGFSDNYVVRHTSCFFRSTWTNTCVTQQFNYQDNIIPDCCSGYREEVMNIGEAASWLVFPNPASDEIHFNFLKATEGTNYVIRIFSEEGILFSTTRFTGVGEANVPTTSLPQGFYFYVVNDDKEIMHRGSFVIAH